MKVYIATPVNARSEATIEQKRQAAYERVLEVRGKLATIWDAEYHSSFDDGIAPIDIPCTKSEAYIMAECVATVMECDVTVMDNGWNKSRGCKVEWFTAYQYGKEIVYYDRISQAVIDGVNRAIGQKSEFSRSKVDV